MDVFGQPSWCLKVDQVDEKWLSGYETMKRFDIFSFSSQASADATDDTVGESSPAEEAVAAQAGAHCWVHPKNWLGQVLVCPDCHLHPLELANLSG